MNGADSTERFADRAKHYAASRPGYPDRAIAYLTEQAVLGSSRVVGDVGAGTGILTRLLAPHCQQVLAIEPNDAMRQAIGADDPRIIPLRGQAEATGLSDRSVDSITAAQAFHWFDVEQARQEFLRVLKADGQVALLWNTRDLRSDFDHAYEELLQQFGTDFKSVRHEEGTEQRLRRLFGHQRTETRFESQQSLSLTGLHSRLLGSSFLPGEGDPAHRTMLEVAGDLFRRHSERDRVQLHYQTEVHLGNLRGD